MLSRWQRAVVGSALPGLVTAAVGVLGIWASWWVFVRTWAGQRVDQAALEGAHYGRTRLWELAEPVLDVISVGFVAAVLLAAMLIAVLRRRWSLAIQVAILMIGANVTTRVLKFSVLDRPDLGIGDRQANTLPSGHTTAAASVSAALVMVVPPRVRPWAAVLGVGYTSATGVSTLIGQWHRPGDVVAALFVVLVWGGLACALLAVRPGLRDGGAPTGAIAIGPGATARATGSTGSGGTRGALVLLGLGALAAGVPAAFALHRTWTSADPFATRAAMLTAYAGGALGVVAVSALVFAGLLLVRQLATARVDLA